MKKLLLLSAVLSILFASCELSPCGFTKDQFVEKHKTLVEQAKKNRKSWSVSDWESRDEKMKKMVEECYENYEEEMSGQELAKFWSGTAAYYFNRHGKGFIKELKDSEKELSQALEKGIRSLENNKGELFKDWLNENFGDDIQKTLDVVGDELKDLGKEIQDWLEE